MGDPMEDGLQLGMIDCGRCRGHLELTNELDC
jgi:hypothetical protein